MTISLRGQRGGRALKTYLISYLALLILPILVWLITLFQSTAIIGEQTDQLNKSMLRAIGETADYQAQAIMADALLLASDNQIRALADLDALTQPAAVEACLAAQQKLSQTIGAHSDIEQIYLYFPDEDYVISQETKASAALFYTISYTRRYDTARRELALSLADWKALLTQYHQKGFTALPAGQGEPICCYLYPMRGAVLVIELRDGTLLSHISRSLTIAQASVSIFSADGALLCRNSPAPEPQDACLRYSHTCAATGWQIVSLVPRAVGIQQQKTISLLALMCVALTVALAVAGIYLVLKRNYYPLLGIMRLLDGQSPSGIQSEYDYIAQSIENVLKGREADSALLHARTQALANAYLERLFLGSADYTLPAGDYLELLGFSKAADTFCVLAASAALPKNAGLIGPKNALLKGRGVLVGGTWAYLIDLTGVSAASQKQAVGALADALAGESPEILLGVSTIRTTLVGLADAFEEARYALEYAFGFGREGFAFFGAIPHQTMQTPFGLTPQEDQMLANLILRGQAAQARQILENGWDRAAAICEPPIWRAKLLAQDLLMSVFKAFPAEQMTPALEKQLLRRFDPAACTPARLRQIVLARFDTLLSQLQIDCRPGGEALKAQVLRYIQGHYADPNLSVESICAHFGRSRSSLFTLFKEQTGDGLLNLIHQTRLSAAKKLLSGSADSLNQIAGAVGYLTVNTFLRVFKRFEGITPGQYRLLNAPAAGKPSTDEQTVSR